MAGDVELNPGPLGGGKDYSNGPRPSLSCFPLQTRKGLAKTLDREIVPRTNSTIPRHYVRPQTLTR